MLQVLSLMYFKCKSIIYFRRSQEVPSGKALRNAHVTLSLPLQEQLDRSHEQAPLGPTDAAQSVRKAEAQRPPAPRAVCYTHLP